MSFCLANEAREKTMTLLYHSFEVQQLKARGADENVDCTWVGTYVPCNTPLIHRPEHELLSKNRAFALSETLHGAYDGRRVDAYVGNMHYRISSLYRTLH